MESPLTIDQPAHLVATSAWFARLGQPMLVERNCIVTIDTLEPSQDDIEEKWDWLPTSQAQDDPFYEKPLKVIAREMGKEKELTSVSTSMYKATLQSLRAVNEDDSRLCIGPHRYAPAAKGAALFAVRMAAAEIVVGLPGFWCGLMPLYWEGHWPCGITDDKRVMVL